MAHLNKCILTIAIPTYNRAKFLERCLNFLADQKEDFENKLEILVLDNCSTDNTSLVVEKFQQLGLRINYIKNTENIGPDLNILKCYTEAKGEYILAMGDDDALLVGAVKYIFKIISENDKIGSVFLTPANIDKINSNNVDERVTYKVFNKIQPYLNHVSYFVTFISANIVNREALNNIDYGKYVNSNLTQVPVILNAVKIKGAINIVVDTKLLAAQEDNSGGYNFFKVFGENFNIILKDIFKDNDRCRKIIVNNIFIRFFPYWMLKLKNGNHTFVNSNKKELINMLGYNLYFWILSYPILITPNPIDKIIHFFVKAFGFLRRKVILKISQKEIRNLY